MVNPGLLITVLCLFLLANAEEEPKGSDQEISRSVRTPYTCHADNIKKLIEHLDTMGRNLDFHFQDVQECTYGRCGYSVGALISRGESMNRQLHVYFRKVQECTSRPGHCDFPAQELVNSFKAVHEKLDRYFVIAQRCSHHRCGGDILERLTRCLKTMKVKINLYFQDLGHCTNGNRWSCSHVQKHCAEVLTCGGRKNGIYTIDPDGKGEFRVYCDQTTNGGGWTVFQKRLDGSVDFFRGWRDYKEGFGNLDGEFWLGLDKINRLTLQNDNRLRIELEDTKGESAYAEYDYFAVSSGNSEYKLSLGTYSGTAGDSLKYHRGISFSTKDRDNDKSHNNCAEKHKGGWWYKSCHASNLNGLYHHGRHNTYADGMNWVTWKGHHYSAKRTEMKIKPN